MAILKLWRKVLTRKVVIDVDEYRHGLRMEGFWRREEELDSHFEKLEIRHEEFAMHELDDQPERVRTRA